MPLGSSDEMADLREQLEQAQRELARLRALIGEPETKVFLRAVRREAAHQRKRWGDEHDEKKSPDDWLWTIAYLSTKATQAARYADREKYLHHIVTTAAVCANWHRLAKAGKA